MILLWPTALTGIKKCPGPLSSFLLAGAAGLMTALSILGWELVNPLHPMTLGGDPATAQVGWEFLRRAEWAWPLTFAQNLGYPFGISIAFLDSIPLIAVALRPFSSLLPEDFQYFGIHLVACFVLQGYFGLRLLRNLCGEEPLTILLGAAFILLAPAFLYRMADHFALSAHWLIVAALSYYTDDPVAKGAVRYLRPFLILVGLAGSINPYLALLTIFVGAAAVLRLWLIGFVVSLTAAAAAAGLLLIGVGSLALFGFFSMGSGYTGGGYGYYSMNVLSPIDPLFGSIILPNQKIGPGQYEGYNYLGLGIIIMLLVGFALQPSAAFRSLWTPNLRPLLFLFFICGILAVSIVVTVGPWQIVSFEVGEFLTNLLAVFRASGRLFWPAHYLLILAGIVLFTRAVRGWVGASLLAALLALQILDLGPMLRSASAHRNAPHPVLTAAVWQTLGQQHRHLVLVPPWQCLNHAERVGFEEYAILPTYAAKQNMTVNSYYSGRSDPVHTAYFCDEPMRIFVDGFKTDTAYVISPIIYKALTDNRFVSASHHCRDLEGFILCTLRPTWRR